MLQVANIFFERTIRDLRQFLLDEEKEKTKYKEKNQATTLSQGRKKCQNTTASPEQLLEERKKTTMQLVIDNFFI